jgi:hypothetical protein
MKLALLLVAGFMILTDIMAYDDSTIKDMPFVTTAKYCLECHSREEALLYRNRTVQSCSVYCSTCHKDLGAHHETDLFLTGKVADGIELLNNKIACFTCHNLKNKRQDSESWKAESLFEKLFQPKTIYPTYFLIERNNKGQLCKKCH